MRRLARAERDVLARPAALDVNRLELLVRHRVHDHLAREPPARRRASVAYARVLRRVAVREHDAQAEVRLRLPDEHLVVQRREVGRACARGEVLAHQEREPRRVEVELPDETRGERERQWTSGKLHGVIGRWFLGRWFFGAPRRGGRRVFDLRGICGRPRHGESNLSRRYRGILSRLYFGLLRSRRSLSRACVLESSTSSSTRRHEALTRRRGTLSFWRHAESST